MLPVFGTTNIIGISVGCLITNIVGVFSGTNILGWMDVIFGTLATLSAGFLTYTFRNIKFKGLPILLLCRLLYSTPLLSVWSFA